jgi:hypothetical protein
MVHGIARHRTDHQWLHTGRDGKLKEKVAASTQNQALSALLFLYRHAPGREVGDLGEVIRAVSPSGCPSS